MGLQYLFVASGATILVPILTGIPVSACLFSAGVGTLIFHFVTKRKVPILLSSSFAFIAPIIAVSETFGSSYAFGAIFLAGLVYLLFALIIYLVGIERVIKLFPTTVTATMVILIGLILAPVAIDGASSNWLIALITFAIGVFVKVFWEKQLLGSLSVILAIIGGTIIAAIGGLVDFSTQVAFVSLPDFTLPQFSWGAISIIVPIAIVTFLEHFADISAVSKVVDQDFLEDPGVHRTLIGDGIATAFAGLIGGCPNTTYSENIGALEMTGVKKPVTLRITAVLLIILAFFPGLAMMIHSIPGAVIGGISILLFGMIASNGVRSLSKVDFADFKNMIIVASMLIVGVGGTVIDIIGVQFSSLAVAAALGVVLNLAFNFKSIFNKG
ncbi:MAG: uracil-xanthine permease family protein [Bacillota bacterium]